MTATIVAIAIAVTIATTLMAGSVGGGAQIGCVEEEGWERCFSETDGDALPWLDAVKACAAKGEEIASSSTSATDDLIRRYLNKLEENSTTGLEYSTWLGGAEDGDSVWRWASDQSEFKVPGNASNVFANFSQVPKLFENCALFSTFGENKVQFRSQLCRRAAASICQYNVTDDNCKPADVRIGTSCYSMSKEQASWFDSANSCSSKASKLAELGVELEALLGAELGAELVNLTQLLGTGSYWVGLRRQPWVWSSYKANDTTSKRPIKTFRWMGDGQPDLAMHDCVSYAVSPTDVGWKSDNCASKKNYVCEKARLIPTTMLLTSHQSIGNDNNNGTNITSSFSDSVLVHYVFPAAIIILAFIILLSFFFACHAYNRRQKGYEDIKK